MLRQPEKLPEIEIPNYMQGNANWQMNINENLEATPTKQMPLTGYLEHSCINEGNEHSLECS